MAEMNNNIGYYLIPLIPLNFNISTGKLFFVCITNKYYTKAPFLIKFEHTSLKKNLKKCAHIRMPAFLEKRIWTASIILEKSPKFLSATYV